MKCISTDDASTREWPMGADEDGRNVRGEWGRGSHGVSRRRESKNCWSIRHGGNYRICGSVDLKVGLRVWWAARRQEG